MFKTKLLLFLLVTTVFALNLFAQDEAEKAGREIYEKYQNALGTKENREKIKNSETISEIETNGIKLKMTSIIEKATRKTYSVVEGGIEGKQESGFDGTRRWVKNSNFRGYQEGGLRATVDTKNIRKLPNETIDGKEYFVLQNVNNNFTVKTYYDINTYLLAKMETTGETAGRSVSQTTIYADYRKVDDVLVPFLQTTMAGTSGFTRTQKILSIRNNIEIDPKIFEFTTDDNIKKVSEKKDDKSLEQATKQPASFRADSNAVYKDENGNVITQAEFLQRKNSNNYTIQPEVADGKLIGMRLVKGSAETTVGTTALDFTAKFIDDSPVQLSQLKGKVVVLNFWFVECAPCIKEMPELNELVKKYEGKEVEFLAITYNPNDQVAEFLKKRQFDYKHIVDAQNIIDSYKATAFPTHIIIDRNGKIKFTQFGYQNGIVHSIAKNIDDALAKSADIVWDRRNPKAIVPENIKKETLNKVWQKINETYFDPTFNGVNWNAVKSKYEPQLTDVKTNQDLTDLLNRLVGELKQSHLKVFPAGTVSINGDTAGLPKLGSIGVDLRLLNKSEVVITEIRPNSPAEKAELKRGYTIKKVNGETVESLVQKQKDKGGFQLRDEIVTPRTIEGHLAGLLDKKVSVTFLDETETEKTIEVERQNFGNSRVLNFEAKELNADVGYIKFNLFIGDLPNKFAEAVAKMHSKKALIVDLRGNPGGIGNHTTAIAAMLDKEKRSLGVTKYRYSTAQFDYEGNDKSFTGKVFILVDERSGSSAEILAAGLQSNKRATVIGRNSAGAVLPSTQELLPNGGVLQFAVGDYKTPDGKVLEGRGVIPDVEVKLTRKDLLAGKDTTLETALKIVK